MVRMDTAGLLRLVLVVLALTMSQVSAQRDINVVEGGNLVLDLEPKPPTLERVVWKHGANLLAEMTLGEFSYYGSFKNHTVLEDSGRLTVSNINQTEGGIYEVEVNNVIQDKRYNVRVFEKLGRPTIRVTPLTTGPGSESCTLVCELDVGPSQDVSYEWQLAGEESRIPGKNLIINKTTKATNFTCWAKNPVSEVASESQKNPLFAPASENLFYTHLAVGLICLGIFLAVIGVVILYRIKNNNLFRGRTVNATPASDSLPPAECQPLNKDPGPDLTVEMNTVPQNGTETPVHCEPSSDSGSVQR
ncbi:CD48 antigen-like [Nelusetta ayraudi]|uniref:CD48 antigen-like n=1 Tax=Nelusetta ayraudi TaxID=303726 RepID=UPI003F71D9B8